MRVMTARKERSGALQRGWRLGCRKGGNLSGPYNFRYRQLSGSGPLALRMPETACKALARIPGLDGRISRATMTSVKVHLQIAGLRRSERKDSLAKCLCYPHSAASVQAFMSYLQKAEVNQRFLFGLKVVLISVAAALSASWLRRMPNPTYCISQDNPIRLDL